MNRKQRREVGKRRLSELRSIAKPLGIEVRVLNEWPMHIRVFGENAVDYWPTTGKAWLMGSASSAHYSPSEVIGLAVFTVGQTPKAEL